MTITAESASPAATKPLPVLPLDDNNILQVVGWLPGGIAIADAFRLGWGPSIVRLLGRGAVTATGMADDRRLMVAKQQVKEDDEKPANNTFAGMTNEDFRKFINQNFSTRDRAS